jgi:hypothetical protein
MARKTVSRAGKKTPAAQVVAEQGIAVIDAGPAPIEFIRRAQVLSGEVIDAGPTRIPAPHPKRPPAFPLNPLRAGAASARGTLQQEAAVQFGGLGESDASGGGAPKRPAGKKRAQRKAKPRPAGKKRRR